MSWFAAVGRLFRGHDKYDTSCTFNDEDNQEPLEDLSRFATAFNQNQAKEHVKKQRKSKLLKMSSLQP